jgi:uncharacterized membrane protein
MTRRRLLAALDATRVEQAIKQTETISSVELRVSIAGLFWGDPQRVAERAFRRLGMTATRQRNGVLLFIVPWRRRVVLIADQGITAKVKPELWGEIVAALTRDFRGERFTDGLVDAIASLGAALSSVFPPTAGDRNELPDTVDPGK